MLMLTWSSLLADVGIVSTLAGCASVLSSDVSAAAVTCAIISPDCRPPWRVRNAGRPLLAGLTNRSERRSLIVARCVRPLQDFGTEKQTLMLVLAINFGLFVVEFLLGIAD